MWILEVSNFKTKKSDFKTIQTMIKRRQNKDEEIEVITVDVLKNENDTKRWGFVSFSSNSIYYALANRFHSGSSSYFTLLLEKKEDVFIIYRCNKEYGSFQNLKKEEKTLLWYFEYVKYKFLASKSPFLKSRSLEKINAILKKSEDIGLKVNRYS